MDFLASFGVFSLAVFIFAIGYILGRRKGVSKSREILIECAKSISLLSAMTQEKGEVNGAERNPEGLNEKA